MAWAEIVEETWIVPAGRMKERREHVVPLSDAASSALRRIRGVLDHPPPDRIFSIGADGMRHRLRLFEPTVTVHGFRSTFRDWAADGYERDVAEACLAHTLGAGAERRYLRTTLIEKRLGLLEAWGRYCCPS